jgi:hypothetical protein
MECGLLDPARRPSAGTARADDATPRMQAGRATGDYAAGPVLPRALVATAHGPRVIALPRPERPRPHAS